MPMGADPGDPARRLQVRPVQHGDVKLSHTLPLVPQSSSAAVPPACHASSSAAQSASSLRMLVIVMRVLSDQTGGEVVGVRRCCADELSFLAPKP
jgi:hypothetical protein